MPLESSADHPQPLGRVVQAVKGWVERCHPIWVEGQVVEIKRRSAATQFLTLRDRFAEVSAGLTCTAAVLDAAGPITEGTTVAAWVKPVVWQKNASLTFECREIRATGEGRLLAQLEQRKRLLQAEGLFDTARKKRLPYLPRIIGLVTAAGSDAERDVHTTVARRWPAAVVTTHPTVMQGPHCAEAVIAALAKLDARPQVDVIVIARGGGALEDLLPFSDEGLVRAVAACRTPVVSAIGHERDTPILDLVADVRASTPTDAGKRLVPDAADEAERVRQALTRVRQAVVQRVATEQRGLDDICSRPVLRDPLASFAVHAERLTTARVRLGAAIDRVLRDESTAVTHDLQRVRSMSPKATLERGYAILVDGAGDGVTSVHDTDEGDDLMAYVADGTLVLEVRGVQPAAGAARPTGIEEEP